MQSRYILQLAEKSRCRYCNSYVSLLAEGSEAAKFSIPWFYICWNCHRIWEVGIGEVTYDASHKIPETATKGR